ARSFSAASFSAASALAASPSASSMSNTLPWRTLATPATPSDFSAPSIALPCGSSTPDLRVTVTRAFMAVALRSGRNAAGADRPPRSIVARGAQHRLALHQHRASALRPFALRHDAEPLGDFRIGFEQAAEIAAETVLVELLVRLDVPQPARIGRNLVRHHDPHHVVFPQAACLHLEVDQPDADAEKDAGEEIVDADRQRHDVVDLLRRRPAERRDVFLRHHRVVELVVLVVELDDRARQLRALLDAEARRERAGRDVAHHDLERNDLDLADQLLAHVEPLDEVRRHADLVQVLEHVFGDTVIEDALAFDDLMLLRIEGSRVVLKVLDQGARLGPLIEDLRLALVDAATAAHRNVPWLEEIHSAVTPLIKREVGGGAVG